ncbi:MAG: iron ABC transporter permease [Syntrophomonas sp.]
MLNKTYVQTNTNSIFSIKIALIYVLPFVALFLGLFLGRYQVSPENVFRIFLSPIFPIAPGTLDIEKSVVLGQRLPRVLLAMLVGAGLSISGATFQALFRNPIVSPDILGVTQGASFGAILALLLFGQLAIIPFVALPFGLLSVFMIYAMNRNRQIASRLYLVLTGIVVSSVFSALISLIKYIADPFNKLPTITYWLMGSFSSTSYSDLKLVALPIISGIVILLLLRWRINILSLGDEEAQSLGINIEKLKWLLIGAVSVVCSAAVTVSGIIGWVGLVIPHIGRLLVGPDHKILLPVSTLLGATFLVFIDIIARTATAAEIPIGILTAIIGAPFFAYLLMKSGGSWM